MRKLTKPTGFNLNVSWDINIPELPKNHYYFNMIISSGDKEDRHIYASMCLDKEDAIWLRDCLNTQYPQKEKSIYYQIESGGNYMVYHQHNESQTTTVGKFYSLKDAEEYVKLKNGP